MQVPVVLTPGNNYLALLVYDNGLASKTQLDVLKKNKNLFPLPPGPSVQ
jgi:hypothetical protein